MNNNQSLDFLPEDEKKEIQEIIKKKGPEQPGDIKMVVPEVAAKEAPTSGEKESWWIRRKKKKEQKKLEEKRKRGETGQLGPVKKKEKKVKDQKVEKSDLFSDVINHEPQKSWWESKGKEKKVEPAITPLAEVKKEEAKPAPVAKPTPIVEPKVVVPPKPIKEKVPPVAKKTEMPLKVKEKKKKPSAKPEKKMHEVAAFGSDYSPSVNLVPEEAMAAVEGQPMILAASILILVVAFWVLVSGVAISRVKKAEAQIQQHDSELTQVNTIIKNYEPGKEVAQKLQKQFKVVEELMDTHLYWTPILQALEETTIPDVYYLSIEAKSSGELNLGAIAKNFDAAARQIRAFEKAPQFFQSVTVNDASVQNQPGTQLPVPIVSFDIKLQLVDNILFLEVPEEVES